MSHSTISYESLAESLAESMGSSVASAIVPNHAQVASDSEPFEAPASPVSFDSDSVEPSFNSKPFSDYASPSISAATDPDNEPLGSPDIADYYGGSEFSEDDPSEDGSIDASSGTDESPPAQDTPDIAIESPPMVRPKPPLPLPILARIDDWIASLPSLPPPSPARSGPSYRRPRSSPSSSVGPPPKRCRVSLAPALPVLALPAMPI
ncbi:hypothetical protein Tco_1339144 [Tanacetum coccineum]